MSAAMSHEVSSVLWPRGVDERTPVVARFPVDDDNRTLTVPSSWTVAISGLPSPLKSAATALCAFEESPFAPIEAHGAWTNPGKLTFCPVSAGLGRVRENVLAPTVLFFLICCSTADAGFPSILCG